MIEHIKGTVVSKEPTRVVIDVNGVGYGLSIPLSTYTRLAGKGCVQGLWSWLHVRDDALQLFGFHTEEEREIFKLLINVSGVGPRMALGIISALTAKDFIEAVRNSDIALLVSIPGIGKKKAERLLLELKDKVGEDEAPGGEQSGGAAGNAVKDAAAALVSLGCGHPEAAAAVRKAAAKLGNDPELEDIIKESLRHL